MAGGPQHGILLGARKYIAGLEQTATWSGAATSYCGHVAAKVVLEVGKIAGTREVECRDVDTTSEKQHKLAQHLLIGWERRRLPLKVSANGWGIHKMFKPEQVHGGGRPCVKPFSH